MTTPPDPIDDARAELARIPAPSQHDLDSQHSRLAEAMRTVTPARRSRPAWLRRRWLPASGLAVAGLSVAILVAVALQPGSGPDKTSAPRGMQVVTSVPGGAFAGLDLESASAADVLRAAGIAAAKGVPEADSDAWTYVRTESGGPDSETSTMERWTSPDGERSYFVSTVEITDPQVGDVGRHYSLHYEHLEREILGDVSWRSTTDGNVERRANWSDDANDGSGELARVVELRRVLGDSKNSDDVRDALYESVEGAQLEFRDGMACGTVRKFSGCSSSGFVPQAKGLSPEESKRLYLTGQLLTIMVQVVYPPDATRAVYDYLATLPEATVAPTEDGSGEVILSLRVKGPSFTTHRMPNRGQGRSYETRPVPGTTFNTKAVAAIDPNTGRIVELGPKPDLTDMQIRYTRFGIAVGPGVGSDICREVADPCEEVRDLEQRLETDPEATFDGVVDWMFISQFCDGMINRDGTPKQGDHMPLSMSKDPKVKVERQECEKREAAAAQGD